MGQWRKDHLHYVRRPVHGLNQRSYRICNQMARSLWSWSKQARGLTAWRYALSNQLLGYGISSLTGTDRPARHKFLQQMMLGRTEIIHCEAVRTDDTQQEWQAKAAGSLMQLALPQGPVSLKWKRQPTSCQINSPGWKGCKAFILPTKKV